MKRKAIIRRRKARLLSSIDEIKPGLHRVWLSGYYDYDDLEKVFNRIKILPNSGRGKRRSNYRTHAIATYWKKAKLSLFLNPDDCCYPTSIIELTSPRSGLLLELAKDLPELTLSRVEYSIDLFISNPRDVRSAFRALRRYSWFPYQGSAELYSTERLNNQLDSKSRYYRVGEKKATCVIYERGRDNDRQADGGFWYLKDCGWIRIEFRIDYHVLRSNGISMLDSFIRDPKFRYLVQRRLKFRRFKKTVSKLPSEYDGYVRRDKYSHQGSFQNEYVRGKRKVKNIAQCIEPVPKLEKLYTEIVGAISNFDKNWRVAYKKSKLYQPPPIILNYPED